MYFFNYFTGIENKQTGPFMPTLELEIKLNINVIVYV